MPADSSAAKHSAGPGSAEPDNAEPDSTEPGSAAKSSAGLLVFRRSGGRPEVLLGHMGGPFWSRRDAAAWSIPKGEHEPGEEPLAAARREFAEELGLPPPDGTLIDLGTARQRSGKVVTVWAVEGDLNPDDVVPGTFTMEWPKGSGRIREFPEIDRAGWFGLEPARDKLVAGQRVFLDRLAERLDDGAGCGGSASGVSDEPGGGALVSRG